ncbi:hypothetical protein [Myroides pelagicus]|uniref:Uncharacterized protein n=1 Tax=Myroides pelagicus TaxID=270914 RepID=A0A7K1GRZ7_9FLAO|nr:hypothetical protein [Myroides pelagicus]MTH30883.1 hypothetical protein [Myroides pelagicus]
MKKTLSLLCLMLFSAVIYAQKVDTLYVKNIDELNLVRKNEAQFYKVITSEPNSSVVEVEDYYLNGGLHARGKAVRANNELIFQGERYIYAPDGVLFGGFTYDKKGRRRQTFTFHPISKERYTLELTKQEIPYSGSFFDQGALYKFKKGKQIKKILFYPNTAEVFEIMTPDHYFYFDQQGNAIGTLSYQVKDNKLIPIEGVFYELRNEKIRAKIGYKDAQKVYSASYIPSVEYPFKLRKEVFYKDEKRVKQKEYYPTGSLKEVSHYHIEEGESAMYKTEFYDTQERLLGEYDNETNSGTKVWFYDSFEKKRVQSFDKGNLVKDEFYVEAIDSISDTRMHFLFSSMDYTNNQADFYDVLGNITSSVTFRQGKPYDGLTYSYKAGELITTNYQAGKKQGVETIYENYPFNPLKIQENEYINGVQSQERWYENGEFVDAIQYVVTPEELEPEVEIYEVEEVE